MNRKDQAAYVQTVIDSLPQGYCGLSSMAPQIRQCNPTCPHYHAGKRDQAGTCTHTRGNPLHVRSGDSCKYELPPR